jgi:hypothetical protein
MGNERFLRTMRGTTAWKCVLCSLALGSVTAAPRPLVAQEAVSRPSAAVTAAHQMARQPIPYRAAEAVPEAPIVSFAPLRTAYDATERHRAWWFWPAVGGGAGALVGHLAGSRTDCSTCEYNRPWQPAATGAVLGALAGAALEFTLRSLGR